MAQVSPESVATFSWMAPMRAMHINRSMMSCFFVAPVRRIRKSFAAIFKPDSFSFNSSDSSNSISSNDSSFARKRSDFIGLTCLPTCLIPGSPLHWKIVYILPTLCMLHFLTCSGNSTGDPTDGQVLELQKLVCHTPSILSGIVFHLCEMCICKGNEPCSCC